MTGPHRATDRSAFDVCEQCSEESHGDTLCAACLRELRETTRSKGPAGADVATFIDARLQEHLQNRRRIAARNDGRKGAR
jgi:hypothetical protein